MNKSTIIKVGVAIAALFVAIVIANAYSTPSAVKAEPPVAIESQGDTPSDGQDDFFDREDLLRDSIEALNAGIQLLYVKLDSIETGQSALVASKDTQISQLKAQMEALKTKALEAKPEASSTVSLEVNQLKKENEALKKQLQAIQTQNATP
ncbi:MAG: hypothetical protein J5980_09430 [Muribaculaceae bacterium]|nr:hypothetical protein [Muribaculaceae bacterium]